MDESALKLLKRILADAPLVSCEHFHHHKRDQNHEPGACPPVARWRKVMQEIEAAVSASSEPKP